MRSVVDQARTCNRVGGGGGSSTLDDPGCDTSQVHTGGPSAASVVSLDDNDPTAGCLD